MKVESYKIKGWKDQDKGLLIAENEDWILVKHIAVDYLIDGYKLYAKKFIKKRKSGKNEQQVERVLKLKQISQAMPDGFKFDSTIEMLRWLESTFGLFEIQDKIESELFYGKINEIEGDTLIIDSINANGKMKKQYDFSLKKIRVITFMTDYFKSIRLLMEDEKGNNKALKA